MRVKATARLRYVSIPPRKMRLVANTIKGLPVQKALDILNFTPKLAARHIAKTVKSAAANALSEEGTDSLRPESLIIKTILVDDAPTAKRIRFQSMGRVYRLRKRFCHLTVRLEAVMEEEPPVKTTRKRAAAKKTKTGESEETKPKATKAKKAPAKSARTKKAAPSKTKKSAGDKTGAATKTKKKTTKATAAKKKAESSPKDKGAEE